MFGFAIRLSPSSFLSMNVLAWLPLLRADPGIDPAAMADSMIDPRAEPETEPLFEPPPALTRPICICFCLFNCLKISLWSLFLMTSGLPLLIRSRFYFLKFFNISFCIPFFRESELVLSILMDWLASCAAGFLNCLRIYACIPLFIEFELLGSMVAPPGF